MDVKNDEYIRRLLANAAQYYFNLATHSTFTIKDSGPINYINVSLYKHEFKIYIYNNILERQS